MFIIHLAIKMFQAIGYHKVLRICNQIISRYLVKGILCNFNVGRWGLDRDIRERSERRERKPATSSG